jgi:hypothetical protein
MRMKPVSKWRQGNRSRWDARNYPLDPDHLPPALRARLEAHPEEVSEYQWVRPFVPRVRQGGE